MLCTSSVSGCFACSNLPSVILSVQSCDDCFCSSTDFLLCLWIWWKQARTNYLRLQFLTKSDLKKYYFIFFFFCIHYIMNFIFLKQIIFLRAALNLLLKTFDSFSYFFCKRAKTQILHSVALKDMTKCKRNWQTRLFS